MSNKNVVFVFAGAFLFVSTGVMGAVAATNKVKRTEKSVIVGGGSCQGGDKCLVPARIDAPKAQENVKGAETSVVGAQKVIAPVSSVTAVAATVADPSAAANLGGAAAVTVADPGAAAITTAPVTATTINSATGANVATTATTSGTGGSP